MYVVSVSSSQYLSGRDYVVSTQALNISVEYREAYHSIPAREKHTTNSHAAFVVKIVQSEVL